MKKLFALIAAILMISPSLFAQPEGCPPIYGISKMTFRISSPELAQSYYGDFLGFDHAFDYESIYGPVLVYKINDRQFFEFLVVDQNVAELGNVISTTFQTYDVDAMKAYLNSKGYETSEVQVDGAGNKVFTTHDDYGKLIEFADMNSSTLHAKSAGKFLSDRRISTHMLHSGLHRNQIEESPRFWCEVLGFKELIRYPADRTQPVELNYLFAPGSTENIESLSSGPDAPREANWEHPCLSVMNMTIKKAICQINTSWIKTTPFRLLLPI